MNVDHWTEASQGQGNDREYIRVTPDRILALRAEGWTFAGASTFQNHQLAALMVRERPKEARMEKPGTIAEAVTQAAAAEAGAHHPTRDDMADAETALAPIVAQAFELAEAQALRLYPRKPAAARAILAETIVHRAVLAQREKRQG